MGGAYLHCGVSMMDSIALPAPDFLERWLCWAQWVKTAAAVPQPCSAPRADWEFEQLVRTEPESAWQAIVQAFSDPRFDGHHDLLVAGPLEELLSLHGELFIERLESLATQNACFAFALSGIWGLLMSEAVFGRVQGVWARRGWCEQGAWGDLR